MRYLFWLWFLPLSVFWSWFGLSYNDVNFGLMFLSRDLHDLVFNIYGSLLGVDPAAIPIMFLKACIFDSALIFAIVAFRKRRQIRAWWEARRQRDRDDAPMTQEVAAHIPAE
ncbi:DUF6105 family protein [Oricola cellulosilytica]|uniref:Uncharacterized protein n=1 Tax=Oricola cellulosilytica TaxID=1429082 RepID=A0A4R0PBR0_9HYPH|nr:DUF6105 family protein [Oricola cellulosilytica]TCD14486.1 hypothetical protein E0D97_10535 [Oricola cellulosilytica]